MRSEFFPNDICTLCYRLERKKIKNEKKKN